jgi:hypothetical protein
MSPTAHQLQFHLVIGFALNAGLWIAQPELLRETGDFERDVLPTAAIGLLAAAAVLPGLSLLRWGKPWQKIFGGLFFVLPLWTLLLIGRWALSK